METKGKCLFDLPFCKSQPANPAKYFFSQRAASTKAVCVHESILGKAASLQVTSVHLQWRACLHADQNQMVISECQALCRPVGIHLNFLPVVVS